jgi:hypothetical protein
MKLTAFCFLLSLTLAACNSGKESRPHFKSINFSYFDISPLSFTIRVSNQDSVFLKQDFAPDKGLQNKTTYDAVLTGGLKKQFDSLMAVINFSKIDSVHETGHIDGDTYSLYIEGDTLKKQFKVHSMSPPKELEVLKELFLKIRASFLHIDTTTHIPLNSPKTKVQGSSKSFILKDINNDKYYLADSVNRVFRQGYIGQSPLVAIDGTVFQYQKKLDTVILPLSKSEILNIAFINKNGGRFIYGKGGENGAIIINTIRIKSTNR